MKSHDFPTPAQITLYLGDVYIDDAYRVEIRDEAPKIPLYGYNEKRYTGMADGKALVVGSLIINYRYPGYLKAALSATHRERAGADYSSAVAAVMVSASVEKRIEMLELARQGGDESEIGEYLRAAYADETKGRSLWKLEQSIVNVPANKSDIEIRIFFDTPENSLYYKAITGVQFTGDAMTISASAQSAGDNSASGMPVFEIYSFIARDIEPRPTPQWWGRTTPGESEARKEVLDSTTPSTRMQGKPKS